MAVPLIVEGKSIADDGIRQIYRSIARPKSADFSADDEIQASSWIADLERLALISRDNVFSGASKCPVRLKRLHEKKDRRPCRLSCSRCHFRSRISIPMAVSSMAKCSKGVCETKSVISFCKVGAPLEHELKGPFREERVPPIQADRINILIDGFLRRVATQIYDQRCAAAF